MYPDTVSKLCITSIILILRLWTNVTLSKGVGGNQYSAAECIGESLHGQPGAHSRQS